MSAPIEPYWRNENGKVFYWLGIGKIPGMLDARDAEASHRLDCAHASIPTYEDRQNGRYYFAQCATCGARLYPIKKSLITAPDDIKPFDSDLRERFNKTKSQVYEDVKVEWDRKVDQWNIDNQALLASWYRWHHNYRRRIYDAYIKSDQWKALRKQVLARDGYRCQVCKTQRAAQVHHLTYERFRNELLEDLLSVCMTCHEAIHNS